MQEIGEQLDSAILVYAILLQLMHCSIASCVLHIACCVGVRSPLRKVLRVSYENCNNFRKNVEENLDKFRIKFGENFKKI